MTKPLHAGHAAHAGVACARLAGAGFTGALDALEHAPGFLTAFSHGGRIDVASPVRAGVEWQICGGNRISVKKYPLCYCTHRAIDGMFDILQSHALEPDDVERIAVSISRRNAVILRNHQPQTGLEAKFSIEFAVAAPVIARRAGLAELTDDFVRRRDVQALMRRVTVTPDDRDNPARPGYAVADRVVVETRHGTRLDSGPVTNARGDHELPLQTHEVWEKFEDCLDAGNARAPARELFETLMSLERVADVRRLIALIEPSARQRAA